MKVNRFPFPESVPVRISHPAGQFAHENFPQTRYAVDFLLPVDTPVIAVKSGKVILVKQDSDNIHFNTANLEGKSLEEIMKLAAEHTNLVAIDHGNDEFTEYLHLRRDGATVQVGQEVTEGDVIGYTGYTGIMTEPHLHYNAFNSKGESIPTEFPRQSEQ